MTRFGWMAFAATGMLAAACVPQGKYDAALKDDQSAHADADRSAKDARTLP